MRGNQRNMDVMYRNVTNVKILPWLFLMWKILKGTWHQGYRYTHVLLLVSFGILIQYIRYGFVCNSSCFFPLIILVFFTYRCHYSCFSSGVFDGGSDHGFARPQCCSKNVVCHNYQRRSQCCPCSKYSGVIFSLLIHLFVHIVTSALFH